MVRHVAAGIQYAPLFHLSLKYIQPRKLLEAETLNIVHPDPADLRTTADRLRWYRHQKGLMQREVADQIGIDRGTYSGYEENGARDYYPLDKLVKLAELYDAPLEMLLDEYNAFLYRGQGRQIQDMMNRWGMSQGQLAERLGVWTTTVNDWVNERVRITKATWIKLTNLSELAA